MSRTTTQLEKFEGRRRFAYRDSEGYLTIGVGILIDEAKGGGLLDAEIDFIRDNRIKLAIRGILDALPWASRLNEPRMAVLINMAYQLGLDGLLKFKKALRAMEDERWPTAALEMRDSRWHSQTPERCDILAQQMETGEWQS